MEEKRAAVVASRSGSVKELPGVVLHASKGPRTVGARIREILPFAQAGALPKQ